MDGATLSPGSRRLAWFGIAAMTLAVLQLLLFGVLGVKREADGSFDIIYYYAAGRALLAGQNPYDPPTLRSHGLGELDDQVARFYYPPQVAPFFMFLGLFSYPVATLLLKAINLAATAGVCVLAVRAVRPPPSPEARWAIPWLLPAIIVGDPWFVETIWRGGIVPLVTLCLMGGWLLAERGRPIPAGILLGLATLKPQFALLPLIWQACERRWKLLAVAAATALVGMSYPLALLGPKAALGGWFGALRLHHEEWCNALGWPHVIGLPNLCYAFGITIPDLKIVTVVLTLALWYFRRRFRPEDILPILILMSVTFLVAHDYDVVVLVPVLIAFWRHLARHPREALIALGLAFLLILPDQVVARTGVPWLYQRCTVVVLILLGWLLRLSRQTPTETGPQLEPQTAPAAGP